jgi:tetratricopeptide (TPR) repeat protein
MLETIHEYARERLAESGESSVFLDRHARHFAARLGSAGAELRGPDAPRAMKALIADQENLRLALSHLLATGDVEAAAELIGGVRGGVWVFWATRGLLEEGRRWTAEVVTEAAVLPPVQRAELIAILGEFLRFQGRGEEAIAVKEQAIELAREVAENWLVAACLHDLGEIHLFQLDNRERARELHEEALALRRREGRRLGIVHALSGLGDLAFAEGDFARAREIYEEILETGRECHELDFQAGALLSLAELARREGDLGRATELGLEGLQTASELGSIFRISQGVETLAAVAFLEGQPERAARLFGANDRLRGESGFAYLADLETEEELEDLRSQLRSASLDAAFAQGRAMTLEEAVAYALEPDESRS